MSGLSVDLDFHELIEKKRASRSVLNACQALVVLMEAGEPLSLGRFAAKAGLAPATAHRILRSLALYQFVRQDQHGDYSLGLGLLELASAVSDQLDIVRVARPHLERLAETTGETVHLAVLEGDRAVYIDKVEGKHSIRLVSRPGYSVPLNTTSLGKVLCAGLDALRLEALLRELAASMTAEDLARFRSEIVDARRRGYATDREELLPGLMCVGAAIRDGDGETVAAVSVAGPVFRMKDLLESHAEAVQRTAADTSAYLGYPASIQAAPRAEPLS